MRDPGATTEVEAFVVTTEMRERAFALARELRAEGVGADLDLAGRSFKGQMKQADRSGARVAVILEGDGTAKLRHMTSGEQRDLSPEGLADAIVAELQS
jgi:histidyl-tRNA synthetase